MFTLAEDQTVQHDDEAVGHWWCDCTGYWAVVGSMLYGPRPGLEQLLAAIRWGERALASPESVPADLATRVHRYICRFCALYSTDTPDIDPSGIV